MYLTAQVFLLASVFAIGVFHTMVPDHWLPIALIARQRHWSHAQTRSLALKAGIGHSISTLILGLIVWLGGVALAHQYGSVIDLLSSMALIAFGLWFLAAGLREAQHGHHSHPHSHSHEHHHDHGEHDHSRHALAVILGSSPMIEGIPAFFAASKYGIGLLLLMAVVFAGSTIATYVLLCTYSTSRLQKTSFGKFERYGEALSGAVIALVGLAFWLLPLL